VEPKILGLWKAKGEIRGKYGDFLNAEGAKVAQSAQKKIKKQPKFGFEFQSWVGVNFVFLVFIFELFF
jgi:hypothetical protein